MKILAIGDIVGENGVEKLTKELPRIRQENDVDFVIVNAENSAGGMGITTKIFEDLLKLKVDVITMGNHTWGKKDIFSFIDHPKLLRPANYSKGVVGKGIGIYNCKNKKIAVMNLIGRTDMNVLSENPFTVANDLINEVTGKVDMIFVDFHAEATAEKIAMGIYLDGKITALYGTHTHVQTADEHILEKRNSIHYRYRHDWSKEFSYWYGSISIYQKICYIFTRKIQTSRRRLHFEWLYF